MPRHLRVFLPASDLGAVWAGALREAAHAAGWIVSWKTIDEAEDQVIQITSDLEMHELQGEWIVMTDDPRALWAEENKRLSEDHPAQDVLRRTSIRLAAASRLASGGARLIPTSALEADFPHLGRVQRPSVLHALPKFPDPALDFYSNLPPEAGARASWGINLFSYPVGKGFDGGSAEMDLTGRARILVHGPHLELPPGVWEARVRFEVDPINAPLRFRFDWGQGDDVMVAAPVIGRSGEYVLTLVRRWTEPGPSQVRVWMMQGAFQGHFAFKGCDISRLADDALVETETITAA